MLVGIADTLVVSYAGEAAVSGVSLVNQFNTIFIYLFTALAIYNSGAAIYRSLGKTNVTMYISVLSNIINMVGNVIGVFVLHAGGAGVAMGPVFITVIGQCMGNMDTEAADYYFTRLSKITLWLSSVWNFLIFIFTPLFLQFYALEPQTKRLVIWLVLIHNIFNVAAFPFSGALSNGLRAAGDVKFTMYVSVLSTIAGRLFLSYLLGIVFHMGVIGIAVAMVCDWVICAVIFIWHRRSGRWKEFKVV